MSRPVIDISGQIFGRLTVVCRTEKIQNKKPTWYCICTCGKEKIIRGVSLKSGDTQSCGCLQKEKITEIGKINGKIYGKITGRVNGKLNRTHGHSVNYKTSKIYKSWYNMKTRCTNSNVPRYKDYGGRGITICSEWFNSFENFLNAMGEQPPGTSLDRINNNGNYTPENCKWSTKKEQANNKRNSIKCKTEQ